jgi:hypothetical protein
VIVIMSADPRELISKGTCRKDNAAGKRKRRRGDALSERDVRINAPGTEDYLSEPVVKML